MKPLSPASIQRFQKRIYDNYRLHGRDLPWRTTHDPYAILVSEIMLQQTQAERVVSKYREFLDAFPDFPSLAEAPLPKLLLIWQGMGYNRRALMLRALARKVVGDFAGELPPDPAILITLPGVGPYTAGAVMAFAFNKPAVFLDTNIRRVYLYAFFPNGYDIRDEELAPLVLQTIDLGNPRKWYNALMDYGAALKREAGNPNRRSAHYTRQSPFENSNRQVRGRILKALVNDSPLTAAHIVRETGMDAARVRENLAVLEKEEFIERDGRCYRIARSPQNDLPGREGDPLALLPTARDDDDVEGG
jgi:A/G-specific adenine glycosylase